MGKGILLVVVWFYKYHQLNLTFSMHHCILTHTSRMSLSRSGPVNTMRSCLTEQDCQVMRPQFKRASVRNTKTRLFRVEFTSSQYNTIVGGIQPVGYLLWNTSDTLKSQRPKILWWFNKHDGVRMDIVPLILYYFAHCIFTNMAVLPLTPLQVISSTKSLCLKTQGDCKVCHLIINTNYHPIRE